MDEDLRERRSETWELLVVRGFDYGDVVSRIATKHGVSETAVQTDISRMEDWLPKLDHTNFSSGVSRLRELRSNRQRRQQMVLEARRDDNRELERELLKEIDWAIDMDVRLSQSLGETHSEGTSLDEMLRAFRDGEAGSGYVPDMSDTGDATDSDDESPDAE